MEYIHAALLLHKAGKRIDEPSVKKVLGAAGITPDEARVKALVASLDGVNIEEAIKKASVPVVQASVESKGAAGREEKKEEKKAEEKEEKTEEKAAEGLSSLFG